MGVPMGVRRQAEHSQPNSSPTTPREMTDASEENHVQQHPATSSQHNQPCHHSLSRATRQLFRQDASTILLHYFGGKRHDAPWRDAIDAAEEDPLVDQAGRKRQRLSQFRVDDGLSDAEWFALLSYAIDQSQSEDNDKMCPLHPSNDALLSNDNNSFILHRRYRSGAAISKYGSLSLPLMGRAARALLWLEEEGGKPQQTHHNTKPTGNTATSIFLFQCGHCEKTFLSLYYLDKHMQRHHPPSLSDSSSQLATICPADHLCEPLGGMSVCAETMNEIAPYYGRGTLLAREYVTPMSDSFFSSSVHSLISYLQHGDRFENTPPEPTPQMQQRKQRQVLKEGDFFTITGEMRHRSLQRNQMLMKALQTRQTNDDIFDTKMITGSCDEEEMERMFRQCRDMMLTCFGNELSVDGESNRKSSNAKHHEASLAADLVTHLCEPIHCNHILHRMAGHTSRHVVHWNEEWEDHHLFSLGPYGWLVVLGVLSFYGCVFVLGVGGESSVLPSHDRKKKTK